MSGYIDEVKSLDHIDFARKSVQEILVTPAIAQDIIDNRNKVNRNFRQNVFEKYLNDMNSGKWYVNEQSRSIGFFEDGNLSDGQHRLHVIAKSGRALMMRIEFGIPKAHSFGIDAHIPRSNADRIKISGQHNWIKGDHISIVNFLCGLKNLKGVSHQAITEHCVNNRENLELVTKFFNKHVNKVSNAPVKAAVMLALRKEDSIRVGEFVKVLLEGMVGSESDLAAVRLRDALLGSRSSPGRGYREYVVKITMRAIKAFCKNKPLYQLRTPKEFIYDTAL